MVEGGICETYFVTVYSWKLTVVKGGSSYVQGHIFSKYNKQHLTYTLHKFCINAVSYEHSFTLNYFSEDQEKIQLFVKKIWFVNVNYIV